MVACMYAKGRSRLISCTRNRQDTIIIKILFYHPLVLGFGGAASNQQHCCTYVWREQAGIHPCDRRG